MLAAQRGLGSWAPKCGACPTPGCHSPRLVLVTQSTGRLLHLPHLLSFSTGVTFEAGETRGTLQRYTGDVGSIKWGTPPWGATAGERGPHSPLVLGVQLGLWSPVCLVLPAQARGQGEPLRSGVGAASGGAHPGQPPVNCGHDEKSQPPSRGDGQTLAPLLPCASRPRCAFTPSTGPWCPVTGMSALTTEPGRPLRPSGPCFPARPWGPTGPVLPGAPTAPGSPCGDRSRMRPILYAGARSSAAPLGSPHGASLDPSVEGGVPSNHSPLRPSHPDALQGRGNRLGPAEKRNRAVRDRDVQARVARDVSQAELGSPSAYPLPQGTGRTVLACRTR